MTDGAENKDYAYVEGDPDPHEIPAAGSLGLLAFGDLGLSAWRDAKRAAYWKKMDELDGEDQPGKEKEEGSRP